jgi:hypothetical protein
MYLLAVLAVTVQGDGDGDGDNRSTKLKARGPSILQLWEGTMRASSHRISPLNFDSLQLLETPRYGLSIRFPRGIIVAALLLCVTGCGGGSGSSGGSATTAAPALASGGATSVYVAESNYSGIAWGILQLPATTNGSVSPTSALILTGTTDLTNVSCIAIDSSGQLYVALENGSTSWEVLVYAAGATGTATPIRTLTGLSYISAMAIDSAGSLYLNNGNAIAVYANTANGSATPSRIITGPATLMDYGEGTLAVDASGNVYTDATNDAIATTVPPILTVLEFSSTANGNVAPSRVISVPSGAPTGATPGLQPPYYYYGAIFAIATDTAGNVYLVGYTFAFALDQVTYSIIEVAAGSSGTVTPLKTITIEPSGSTLSPSSGLRVDAAGNMYFVAQGSLAYVGAYGPSSSGTQSPALTITSPSWVNIGEFPTIVIK